MRHVPLLLVVILLAGCGASTTSPSPTAKPTAAGYTDPVTGVATLVTRHTLFPGYALLYMRLRNTGKHLYQPNPAFPAILDSALVEPNIPGTIGSCSADSSLGTGLDYSSLPSGAVRRGWIRCDFPAGTHVLAVFWGRHSIATYRVG